MNIAKANPLEHNALNGHRAPWRVVQRNSTTRRLVRVNVSSGTPDSNVLGSIAPPPGALFYFGGQREKLIGVGLADFSDVIDATAASANDSVIHGYCGSEALSVPSGNNDTFTDLSTHDYSSHISDASLNALYTRASVAIKGGGSISAADLSTLQDLSKKIAGCAYFTGAGAQYFINQRGTPHSHPTGHRSLQSHQWQTTKRKTQPC